MSMNHGICEGGRWRYYGMDYQQYLSPIYGKMGKCMKLYGKMIEVMGLNSNDNPVPCPLGEIPMSSVNKLFTCLYVPKGHVTMSILGLDLSEVHTSECPSYPYFHL